MTLIRRWRNWSIWPSSNSEDNSATQKGLRMRARWFNGVKHRWTRLGLGVLAGYLLSYVLMSLGGHPIVANHGGSDWRREWCPRFLVEAYVAFSGRTRTTLTPLGMLYWPCICVDHLLWHRTRAESPSAISGSGHVTVVRREFSMPGFEIGKEMLCDASVSVDDVCLTA